jgi:geranyl-CoA carboxylase alpha subunit
VVWQPTSRRWLHTWPIPVRLGVGAATHSLALQHQGGRHYQVAWDGQQCGLELLDLQATDLRYAFNGVQASATWVRDGDQLGLHALGQAWHFTDQTRAASQRQDPAHSDGKLRASMNGRVVAVMVAVGDQVQQGQTLLTLEAMKMEHLHLAPASGVVKTLNVAVGDQVPASRVVVEIEMNKQEVAS